MDPRVKPEGDGPREPNEKAPLIQRGFLHSV